MYAQPRSRAVSRWLIGFLAFALCLGLAAPVCEPSGMPIFLPLVLKRHRPQPRPTATVTRTPKHTLSPTPTWTATRTATATPTASCTVSPSPTATASPTLTETATFTPTPTATGTSTPSPTASPTPTETLVPTVIVYGRVTLQGEAAQGAEVQLWLYDLLDGAPFPVGALATDTTDEEGYYALEAEAPNIAEDQRVGVRYKNEEETEGRLAFWYGITLAPDPAGGAYHGGDFDIADILLLSPSAEEPQPLPVTFRWLPRETAWAPDDLYQVAIEEPSSGAIFYSDWQPEDEFTLWTLPDGFSFGAICQWWVLVEGASGHGRSLRGHTFSFAPAP